MGEKLAANIPLYTQGDDSDSNSTLNSNQEDNFEVKVISVEEVSIALSELKSSNSCGLNGVTAKLLKQAGPGIISPLQYIFNMCIQNVIFPTSWKTVSITLLFKEGDTSKCGNYRPIWILLA